MHPSLHGIFTCHPPCVWAVLTHSGSAFTHAIALSISMMRYNSKTQAVSKLYYFSGQRNGNSANKVAGRTSQHVSVRVKRGLGKEKILGQVTDYLFLESGRNINSPQGRKSGGNVPAISHGMLIARESHFMLLEMNQ